MTAKSTGKRLSLHKASGWLANFPLIYQLRLVLHHVGLVPQWRLWCLPQWVSLSVQAFDGTLLPFIQSTPSKHNFLFAMRVREYYCNWSHLFTEDKVCRTGLIDIDGALKSILWDQYLQSIFLHWQNVSLLVKNSLLEENLCDKNNIILTTTTATT